MKHQTCLSCPASCRVANNNLLKGQAFDDAIGELLRTQLS